VYSFTVAAYRRQPVFSDERVSRCTIEVLRDQSALRECRIFTFCLMPDHLHVLASPERDGICVLDFVDRFKGASTNASWGAGASGKLWEPRYYDHIVRKDEDLLRIAQYILDNPVRKGLVESAGEWPWSGQMNPLPL
jgi:putative transposase